MNLKDVYKKVKELQKELPAFEDGRIDYHNSSVALVVDVFIISSKGLLLLKRSGKVHNYPHFWAPITGFIDEKKDIKDIILKEIKEEIGLDEEDIISLKIGEIYTRDDDLLNKKWIIVPVKVEIQDDLKITLDWEHDEYKWIDPEDLESYKIIPGIDDAWQQANL
ncbi:MAG: NUDIX hydrolase [candidate division CPR2 bacterium GW2011_GWC2_39_10]|uniref:NUDIX hydrolase n=1 Tax=candidate division CPR2 bacterium GW2011_GWC2_39_10 TaxID=1618345 RepID=A0A0G0LNN8_UNCC2|nr:MAG: NUDIX hydrolase [candidate division CPR2 bacterium GW2011_GWC2_39_10]